MVGSWCPPNSEVHGLVLHGQAVRSIFIQVVGNRFSVKNSLPSWLLSRSRSPAILLGARERTGLRKRIRDSRLEN